MKMQIKNSHKVITGIAFLVALLFITAFKMIEQSQNTSSSQTKADSLSIDIPNLLMGDKVEALRKFITGQLEVEE
jgi:hypothetical protein